MKKPRFYLYLLFTTVLCIAGLGLLHVLSQSMNWVFDLTNLVFFVVLSWLMYFLGDRASKDQNPYRFTRIFLGFTFMKVFISILIIAVFVKLSQSGSRGFLYSFLLIYLCFTSLETMVFMRLSKPQP